VEVARTGLGAVYYRTQLTVLRIDPMIPALAQDRSDRDVNQASATLRIGCSWPQEDVLGGLWLMSNNRAPCRAVFRWGDRLGDGDEIEAVMMQKRAASEATTASTWPATPARAEPLVIEAVTLRRRSSIRR